jgi:hypothetical protein
MDPKQALTKRSGQALEWPRQKLKVLPVEVRKAGAQTSYRPWKVGKDHLGAVHSQKVSIPSLK